ncbi:MAG: prephenate dehydrogenase/arogenate dehydrogenase family protein [Deltaproteobacteria bacterium]|jgi:prephenate dehydrogenase|nr:prephenate dehydrogenase/arogenate dehydrogenase family protein [Deltaproteobacteria bacterium]
MPKFKLPPRLPFRCLGVAGLGLIGGSIAKALMPFDGLTLMAFDSDPDTVKEARKIKRFARVTMDADEFLSWPLDLAYLCLPVRRNVELIERMGRLKVPYAVTDSGSTKGPANEAALAFGLNFCGGHPIAGKEVAGFSHSKADLIRNCLFILTPDERFGPGQKELLWRLNNLHQLLGCRIRFISPSEHDRIYGLISHLPYLSASALAGTALAEGGHDILSWVGTGFKDSTRVGASPPAKWVEVAMENSDNLVTFLGSLINLLGHMRDIVGRKDAGELMALLDKISAFRRILAKE